MNFYNIRRFFLRNFIPEFIWPIYIYLDDVKFQIRKMPYSYGIKRMLVKNQYECSERLLVNKYLRPSDSVIELGSSIGILSKIIANKINLTSSLYCLEADENLIQAAQETINDCSNQNIHFFNGFFAFAVDQNTYVFDRSLGSLGGQLVKTDKKIGITIDDLNTLYNQKRMKANFLICDIEGSEESLLIKNSKIPLTIKRLLIELHPHVYGTKVMDNIIRNIKSRDFKLVDKHGTNFYFEKK
ncbi:hypothetical protein ABXT57_02900 [Methylophilaceae bacterium Uisw_097]|jgi:FkbM family methyltransferase